MSENKTLQVSLAGIELLDGEQTFEGTPIDPSRNEPEVGKLISFRVSTTDTLVLKVGVVSWPSGTFDVIPYEKVQGLMKHDFLESRGRTSLYVQENGDWMFILRTLKWNESQQKPNLADASLPELSEIAEEDFEELLKRHGAKAVGTREKLVGETNRNRFQLAMLVEPNNLEAIAVAFTVTRVLAVVKDFGMETQ